MYVHVKGNGVSLSIYVNDELDAEIVRLAMLMANRHRNISQFNLF